MTTAKRVGIVLLCTAVAAAALLPPLIRAAATSNTTVRSADDIDKDLKAADQEYFELMPTPLLLGDAEFRSKTAPKMVPVLKKLRGYFAELETADPSEAATYHTNSLRLLAYAAIFGDADSLKQLETMAASKKADALAAAADLQLVRWVTSTGDAVAQAKTLDAMTALAKENSHSKDVASILNYMANIGASNNDLVKKIIDIIRANVMVDGVDQLLTQLDGQQAQLALVGKPLSFEGRTSTGGAFRLDSYKGKVVMLDFWATWCGPCIDELPNVKKAYQDYHDKGFEIVGLSCDEEDGVLNDFIKKNGMPWVQLREKSQTEDNKWHPLTKKYGVNGIPSMFLVDRDGVLRYVDARDDLEKKIDLLLKETPKP